MELIETFKYFAKFPAKDGVLKNFSGDNDSPEYIALYDYVNALPSGLIPEIGDMIISIDEKRISDRIRNIDGFFMMLEYSGIQSSAPDQTRNRNTSSQWAVIIAHPASRKNSDIMGEAVLMDKALSLIKQILDIIKTDDAEKCGNNRMLDSNINIRPVEPKHLYEAIGWEFSFRKTNNLLI